MVHAGLYPMGLGVVIGFAGCAISDQPDMQKVMAQCTKRAQDAVAPDVTVGVSVSAAGMKSTGLGVSIGADHLKARDVNEIYETCVMDLTGESPPKPLRLSHRQKDPSHG